MIADGCNNVLTTGTRKLAVIHRPSEDVDADDPKYIPCQFCHGYFSWRQLWYHAEKCRCNPVGVQSCHRVRRTAIQPHQSQDLSFYQCKAKLLSCCLLAVCSVVNKF